MSKRNHRGIKIFATRSVVFSEMRQWLVMQTTGAHMDFTFSSQRMAIWRIITLSSLAIQSHSF